MQVMEFGNIRILKPNTIELAHQVMNLLGIEDLKSRQFSTMSTGEQRKFLLARALVHDPEVLVLDEPTSGLDLRGMFSISRNYPRPYEYG